MAQRRSRKAGSSAGARARPDPPPAAPDRRADHARDRDLSRQARLVSIVIAGAMVVWLGAQFLGGRMGWPVRFVFLFDLAALAAFFWALVATYRIWRARRES